MRGYFDALDKDTLGKQNYSRGIIIKKYLLMTEKDFLIYKVLYTMTSDAQHAYITKNYVEPIARSIRELDNN